MISIVRFLAAMAELLLVCLRIVCLRPVGLRRLSSLALRIAPILFCALSSQAQSTQYDWTWISGSDSTDQPGIYGNLGTPAVTNTPGSRYIPLSWTDSDGNLWLFGGRSYVGNESNNGNDYLNDLWEYSPATNEWRASTIVRRPDPYAFDHQTSVGHQMLGAENAEERFFNGILEPSSGLTLGAGRPGLAVLRPGTA